MPPVFPCIFGHFGCWPSPPAPTAKGGRSAPRGRGVILLGGCFHSSTKTDTRVCPYEFVPSQFETGLLQVRGSRLRGNDG